MAMQKNNNKIVVWDPLVRLFHWTLVIACITAYITQEENYDLHLQSGYLIIGLICFRIIWGFIGSDHARFSDFVYRPATVLKYLKESRNNQARRYLGHNPAGGIMVVLMILILLIITLSGVALDAAENRAGPLSGSQLFLYTDMINMIHNISTHIATAMVLLHILGVIFSGKAHNENLVLAMITGKKRDQQV